MTGWTERRWDRARDLLKHEPRPGDRLQRRITTAEDIAICIRGMKNLEEAAALIEQYADMVAKMALAEAAEQRALALESPVR